MLVMVERVSPGPVAQTNLGIGQPLAVEIERLARLQQHVRQPRERNEGADRVAPLRQRRRADAQGRPADVAERAIALAEAAAPEPGLAEHRRERHREARRLLAGPDALG